MRSLTYSTAPACASRAHIELVHRNAVRLLNLVNTLLDFSRIEAGRMRASKRPNSQRLPPNWQQLQSACDKAGLGFVVDCPPLPEPVFVDIGMWEKNCPGSHLQCP